MQASIKDLKVSRLVALRFVEALKNPIAFCSNRDRASIVATAARRLRKMGLDAYLMAYVYDSSLDDWDTQKLAEALELAKAMEARGLI